MKLLSASLILGLGWWQPSIASPKVAVEVIIESFCPCSGVWEYVFSTEVAPLVGEIVELRRNFDASAKGSQHCCDPSAPPNATCFHGMTECTADALQRCAQAIYPDWNNWLKYTTCINGPCKGRPAALGCKNQFDVGAATNLGLEESCASQLSMNWTTINECWQGPEAKKLMQEDADRDNSLKEIYGKDGLPVVYINGTFFSHFWDCNNTNTEYQKELVATICKASTASPLPAACQDANEQ